MKRVIKALASLAFAASNAAYAGLIGDEVQARWIFCAVLRSDQYFRCWPRNRVGWHLGLG